MHLGRGASKRLRRHCSVGAIRGNTRTRQASYHETELLGLHRHRPGSRRGRGRAARVALAGKRRETPPDAAAPAVPPPQQQAAKPSDEAPAPSFDAVHVGQDGRAVIAGRAAPGADITVLDRDQPVAQAKADANGEWVAMTDKPLSTGPQELSLRALGPSGETREARAPASRSSCPSMARRRRRLPCCCRGRARRRRSAHATRARPAI